MLMSYREAETQVSPWPRGLLPTASNRTSHRTLHVSKHLTSPKRGLLPQSIRVRGFNHHFRRGDGPAGVDNPLQMEMAVQVGTREPRAAAGAGRRACLPRYLLLSSALSRGLSASGPSFSKPGRGGNLIISPSGGGWWQEGWRAPTAHVPWDR